jgi:Tfp pilus assembly protein PilX
MTRRLVRNEEGVALVLALMAMVVLSTLAAGLLVVVSVNHRSSLQSLNAKKAFGIAEVGLAYAEGNVYGAAAAHGTPTTGSTTFTQDGGSGTYWASVAGDGHTWTMHGQGTYGGVTRQVSAQADVPSPVTVSNSGVWNYLYADSVTGSCPTTIGGSTTVAVPVLTRGNLCLQSQFSGAQLEVGGNLVVSGGKGQVGTSASKVPNLYVGGTCDGVTTGTGVCDGGHSPIYATNTSTTLPVTPQMPPLNLSNVYSSANPGPGTGHGCQTGSNVPSPFFDSDSTLNNGLATVNLFPATAYDCINGANEISWQPGVTTTGAHPCPSGNCLYVNGTFYFDGSLSLSGNSTILYSGTGTLYFTGTISTAGGIHLCGVANCTSAWNTDNAAMVFVAGCWADTTGTSLVTSKCVNYGGNAVLQVATYCTTDYFIAGTATNWGPVLANTLQLNGNMSTLVPFHIMPPGTPLNTDTVYLPASAPTYWNG